MGRHHEIMIIRGGLGEGNKGRHNWLKFKKGYCPRCRSDVKKDQFHLFCVVVHVGAESEKKDQLEEKY